MSPGATFDRIYHALKAQLGSGQHRAGAQLEPAALAADLCASITPVRDALHRLVGEGLVEAPRGDGFRTPLVTEIGLRNLYRWHGAVIDLAARLSLADRNALEGPDADLVERTERLFLWIAAASLNGEHVAAVARMGERLRPARRAELGLLADAGIEIDEIASAAETGDRSRLRRLLARYHRARERLADRIVGALHDLP